MWIGVLWAGLRVAMWIAHVGGKFRHGLLEKSLKIPPLISFIKNYPVSPLWLDPKKLAIFENPPNRPPDPQSPKTPTPGPQQQKKDQKP